MSFTQLGTAIALTIFNRQGGNTDYRPLIGLGIIALGLGVVAYVFRPRTPSREPLFVEARKSRRQDGAFDAAAYRLGKALKRIVRPTHRRS